MSSQQQKHTRRRSTARTPGQALPLIGLMIVVVVAMVGLSVDVGNTFSEERQAVAAANAASVAGFDTYIDRTGSTTNQSVYNQILNTLNANGVQVAAPGAAPENGELVLEALYLDAQGKLIENASPIITNEAKPVPANVSFIQVNLEGRVGTYFARVVGRGDLPISAVSHAGYCPSNEGIYPIAVNTKWLEGDKFRNPGDVEIPLDGKPDNEWRVLGAGSKYPGRTAMRLDVQDGPSSGGFSWLRWMEDKGANGASAISAPELQASLTVPGNAGAGFDEAPWPNANKPTDYPTQPGQLNAGDWVWGTPGYKNSADPFMDLHMSQGNKLVLPIYDEVQGQGSKAQYQIVDFGIFVVLSHGQAKGEKYIELVYLGDGAKQKSACVFNAAPDPAQIYTLFGDVQLRPEYAYNPADRKPIQYVVVLDVSGSMSANFNGQCDQKSSGAKKADKVPGTNYWQCSNGPDGAPAATATGTGPDYWWGTESERRIYVAKKALESLVRSTNMVGNGEYDVNRPVDQVALVWFNSTVDKGTGNYRNFSSDPNTIITNINDAGKTSDGVYRTQGGTNGAAGLYRAALAFDAAPKKVNFGGKDWDYKRVTIFITDGVSNQFLNKSANNLSGGSSSKDTYPSGHKCNVSNVAEIATCQVTGTDSNGGGLSVACNSCNPKVAGGMDRPITQAGNVSRQDIQPKGAEVYAISLSNIPDTGLKDSIASFPKYYFAASGLNKNADGSTNVDDIMKAINTAVETGLCTPRSDALDGKPEWRSTIPPDQFQAFPGSTTYPVVGEVFLTNVENGSEITIPITADSNGTLTYRKEDVPKGSYKLEPYLFYRHPLDPPTAGPRRYSLIDTGAGAPISAIVVNVGPGSSSTGSFNQQVRQDLKLRLLGDVCAKK
jgi:Putative Flp pilus-assembly TadE/G-like